MLSKVERSFMTMADCSSFDENVSVADIGTGTHIEGRSHQQSVDVTESTSHRDIMDSFAREARSLWVRCVRKGSRGKGLQIVGTPAKVAHLRPQCRHPLAFILPPSRLR